MKKMPKFKKYIFFGHNFLNSKKKLNNLNICSHYIVLFCPCLTFLKITFINII